ncbi:MAG: ester cyclase [Leptospirales bacterium]|nr:ester cyclase [Leptospirales bacterium]
MNQETERNKNHIKRFYELCINRGAMEILEEIIAPEFVGPQGEEGPIGFAGTVQGLRKGFPDIQFQIQEIVAEADVVMVHWTWEGTHQGKAFGGYEPTNKSIHNDGMAVYHFNEGKIVRARVQMDRLGVLQQMGVVPANPGLPGKP